MKGLGHGASSSQRSTDHLDSGRGGFSLGAASQNEAKGKRVVHTLSPKNNTVTQECHSIVIRSRTARTPKQDTLPEKRNIQNPRPRTWAFSG